MFFILILLPVLSFGQLPLDEKGEGLMRREVYGGVTFATHGWGIGVQYHKQKNYRYKHSFGVRITNIRHPKETKSFSSSFEKSKGYYYGKMNSVVAVRPFYGGKRVLFEKTRHQGVEINLIWGVGISLTLMKPVYLKIKKFDSETNEFITIEERYDPENHHPENIFGRSNWFKGLGDSKITAGLFSKFGFYFDLSAKREFIWGVELGGLLDVYVQKIPIMYNSSNTFIYPALYANIVLGKRLM